MTTHARTKLGTYVLGDALTGIPRRIKTDSVKLTFTSPPGIHQTPFFKERDTKGYLIWLNQVLPVLTEVTKPSGWIVLSQANAKQHGEVITTDVTFTEGLRALGWTLKEERILVRNGTDAVNLYVNTWQHFLAFTQTGKVPIRAKQGRWVRDVWVYKHEQRHNQPIWPQSFVQMVISALTKKGDLVLDPFAGVGPVLAGAYHTERRYLGFEIDRKYWNPKLQFSSGLL